MKTAATIAAATTTTATPAASPSDDNLYIKLIVSHASFITIQFQHCEIISALSETKESYF